MASRSLGYIGSDGARGLGHLVEEAVTWVDPMIDKAITEALCGQLYDIGEHPGIEPEVGGCRGKSDSHREGGQIVILSF